MPIFYHIPDNRNTPRMWEGRGERINPLPLGNQR